MTQAKSRFIRVCLLALMLALFALPSSARIARRSLQLAVWEERLRSLTFANETLRAQASDDQTRTPVLIETSEIGQSSQGASLLLVKISSLTPAAGRRKCVLVVAGQHGDEPGGPEGALTLMEEFATSTDPSIEAPLHDTDLYIIPVANPDGLAAGTRRTTDGIDLNRDWTKRISPEARAIWSCITRLKPDAIVDLHEHTPADSGGTYVLVTHGTEASRAAISQAFLEHGFHFPARSDPGSSTRLLFRSFARAFDRPAYLIETKYTSAPDRGLADRGAVQLTAVMSVVKGFAPTP